MGDGQARRVALVTGAAVGIGQAIAVRLAAEGLAVAVGYHARPAADTVAAILAAGGEAIAIDVDVTASAGSMPPSTRSSRRSAGSISS